MRKGIQTRFNLAIWTCMRVLCTISTFLLSTSYAIQSHPAAHLKFCCLESPAPTPTFEATLRQAHCVPPLESVGPARRYSSGLNFGTIRTRMIWNQRVTRISLKLNNFCRIFTTDCPLVTLVAIFIVKASISWSIWLPRTPALCAPKRFINLKRLKHSATSITK